MKRRIVVVMEHDEKPVEHRSFTADEFDLLLDFIDENTGRGDKIVYEMSSRLRSLLLV